MSSLYYRGKSVWIGFTDVRGGRHNRALGIKVERVEHKNGRPVFPREAHELKKKIEDALRTGVWNLSARPNQQVKLSEALMEFLETKGSRHKPSTVRNEKLAVKRLQLTFGDCFLAEITEEDLYRWRGAMLKRMSEYSVANTIRHLAVLFSWAERRGYIDKSLFDRDFKINPPKPQKAVYKRAELDTIFKILDAEKPHLAAQLRFLYLTGFRAAESCNFKWEQIDFDDRVIKHWNEKESRWESYPLDRHLEMLLKGLPRSGPYVFHYRDTRNLYHPLKTLVKKLGYNEKLGLHSLKKTFVKNLIEAGVPATKAHRLAHHKSFQTTLDYYAEFDIEDLRKELEKSRK